jgi:hypothetical protein
VRRAGSSDFGFSILDFGFALTAHSLSQSVGSQESGVRGQRSEVGWEIREQGIGNGRRGTTGEVDKSTGGSEPPPVAPDASGGAEKNSKQISVRINPTARDRRWTPDSGHFYGRFG